MIDRIFSAALTFCLLIAGTLAIGSALFGQDTRSARTSMPVIELPAVTVIGQRTAMAVDPGSSKLAANTQDGGDCTLTDAVAPAAQPTAPAHI